VARIRDHHHLHPYRPGAEQLEQFVIRDRPFLLHVVRAEALVGAIRLVTVLVGHEGAVAGVLDDGEVAGTGAGEEVPDGLADRGAGGLAVEEGGDLEAALPEDGGPIRGVVEAPGKVAVGAGLVIDADAEPAEGHGGGSFSEKVGEGGRNGRSRCEVRGARCTVRGYQY
jgi:hypothetical protein